MIEIFLFLFCFFSASCDEQVWLKFCQQTKNQNNNSFIWLTCAMILTYNAE